MGQIVNTLDANNEIELIIECLHGYLDEIRGRDDYIQPEKGLSDEEKQAIDNAGKEIEKVISGLTPNQISLIVLHHAFMSLSRKVIGKEKEALENLRKELIQTRITIKAQAAAHARHQNSQKQKAKEVVHDLWRDWQQNAPARYRSASAFAKDMLDKFPDELFSQMVIQGWATKWKRELKSSAANRASP